MTNATSIKSLNELSLKDAVLPSSALENIIEKEELEAALRDYVTTEGLDNAIADLNEEISENYATATSVARLTEKVIELEALVRQLTETQQDDGQTVSPEVVIPSTIITVPDDQSEEQTETPTGEQTGEQTSEQSEQQPVEFRFTGIKSTSTAEGEENEVRVGEDITIYGLNLLSEKGLHRLYAQRIRAGEENDEQIELDPEVWLNDDWSNFTNNSLQIPSAIWNEAPFTDVAVDDFISIAYVKMRYISDTREFVQESSITAVAKVIAPAQQAMTASRRRKAK